jgi:hypothetical protein
MERMVRKGLAVVIVLAVPTLAAAAERPGSDVSIGYSMLQSPRYSGVQAAYGWQARSGLGFDVDYSLHFDHGGRLHVFAVGPRLSRTLAPGVAVSGHLLASLIVFNYGDGGGAIGVYPGVAVDFGADKAVGCRIQGDWPFIAQGIVPTIPRVSASVIFRLGRR